MKSVRRRRLSGIFGIGRWWAVAWAMLGPALVALIQSMMRGTSGAADQLIAWLLVGGIQLALYGFLAGSLFGSIIAFAERRNDVRHLGMLRFAAWGLLAGMGVPGLNILAVRWIEGIWLSDGAMFVWIGGSLGVVSAVATLTIAHLGDTRTRALKAARNVTAGRVVLDAAPASFQVADKRTAQAAGERPGRGDLP